MENNKYLNLEGLVTFWGKSKEYMHLNFNNYIHPNNNETRHVTDVEKSYWNGKADGNHTHVAQTTVAGNAGTATRLQTARSINGTNFNGSANITTAKWGAARYLQIGNTAKSVNGSGNVTWSVTEIGAVNKGGDTLNGPLQLQSHNINFTAADTGDTTFNEAAGTRKALLYSPNATGQNFAIVAGTTLTINTTGLTSSGTITGTKVYNAVFNDYAELFPKLETTITEEGGYNSSF